MGRRHEDDAPNYTADEPDEETPETQKSPPQERLFPRGAILSKAAPALAGLVWGLINRRLVIHLLGHQ